MVNCVDFFYVSEWLYSFMKNGLYLNSARYVFQMTSDNPYLDLGGIDCNLLTSRTVLKDDCDNEWNGHAFLYSHGVNLFVDSSKDFYHSRQLKPVFSRKPF